MRGAGRLVRTVVTETLLLTLGSRRVLGSAVLEAVRSVGDRLLRSFAVIEPGRVRVSAARPHDPRL